jgi:hypothetical protein
LQLHDQLPAKSQQIRRLRPRFRLADLLDFIA